MRPPFLLCAAYAGFLSSCTPTPQPVEGDVFIATTAGQNIKLGAVDVTIYDGQDSAAFFGRLTSAGATIEATSMLRDSLAMVVQAFERFTQAERELTEANKSAELTSYWLWQPGIDRASRAKDVAQRKYFELRDALNIKRDSSGIPMWEERRDSLNAQTQRLMAWEYLSSPISPPVAKVVTDAEGKFHTLLLPGSYLAVARSTRAVGKAVEEYRWALPFAVRKGEESRVMLTSANLLSGWAPM